MEETIATNLKALMDEKNIIYIKDLAKKTKISVDTIYKYFDKNIMPSVNNLLCLSDYLDFLLGRTDLY